MGGSMSLQAQPRFPRVVNQRFVDHSRTTTLVLDDHFFLPGDFDGTAHLSEIRDADVDAVVFKVQRPSCRERKMLLLNGHGVPVVSLECFPAGSQIATYEATDPLNYVARHFDTAALVLARFETDFRPCQQRLTAKLGRNTAVHCTRRWEDKDALLHVIRATSDGGAPVNEYIARVQALKLTKEEKKQRRAQGLRGSPYTVTIAPGVDIAFVVLVCAALDQEAAKKDDIFCPTEEDTARPANRPTHRGL